MGTLTRGRGRLVTIVGLTAALVIGAVSLAGAHVFFLIPGAFPFASGGVAEFLAQSSSRFPTSAGAVAVARVAKADDRSRWRA